MTKEEQDIYNQLTDEQKAVFDKINHQANIDALTGLQNRSAFAERIKRISPVGLCIVSCDANNLKKTNDEYGHNAGDMLLKVISVCIKEVFGLENCYRTGGDEFTVVLEGTGDVMAQKMVERVQRKITLADEKVPDFQLSCSFGVAVGNGEQSIEEIIGLADNNMYIAKREFKKETKQNIPQMRSETEWELKEAKIEYKTTLKKHKIQRKKDIKSILLLAGLMIVGLVIL